jgi:hypothetical protein
MEQIDENELKKALRIGQIIGWSLIGAVVVYGIVAYLVDVPGREQGIDADKAVLLRNLGIAYFVAAFVGTWLARSRLKPSSVGEASTLTIRLLAFSEALAVFGLVIVLMGGSIDNFHPLALMSVVLIGFNFPRESVWERWLAKRREA